MKQTHGIRLLVTLLALLLALAVFGACNKTPEGGDETTGGGNTTTAGGETTAAPAETDSIRVEDYVLVIPEAATETETDAANSLMAAVSEKLGASFKETKSDFAAGDGEIDPNAFEILVGATNRPESASAIADLNGSVGYAVAKIGNKIVINASVEGLVDDAVAYFITEYVEKGASGAFEVPKSLSDVKKTGGVSLMDGNNNLQFTLVYDQSLDVSEGADDRDKVDYVVQFYLDLNMTMMSYFEVDTVNFSDDKLPADANRYELLLGTNNRPETQAFLNTLKVNEYGYGVVGNKIVVAGWSPLTTGKAIDMFIEDLPKYTVETEQGKNLILLESDKTVDTYKMWNADIPLYTGGTLKGVAELLYDSYEAYYENTNAEEYNAYCATLPDLGYQLYQQNRIGENLYATYRSTKTMIHVYYIDSLGIVRLVTESMATVKLPQNKDEGWEKITDTTFTMMDLDAPAGVFGNCFIITLEDGSFILNDGGGDLSRNTGGISRPSNNENAELYRLLQSLNKRKDGKIVIAAWIISHQHWDHIKNGYDMISNYYKENLVVERVIFNVAAPTTTYNSYNPEKYFESGKLNEVSRRTGAELIRMHTGQTIQIRNLKLEVIYTTEDLFPDGAFHFNNTSLVHRFKVGEGENEQLVQILGDIEDLASEKMIEMYGDNLKCDVMQVAHHGYGGTVELYKRFSPTVVLWPKDQNAVNAQLTGSGYYPTINQSLVNQSNVKLVVVADGGHKTVPLPVVGLSDDREANHDRFVTAVPRFDGN